MNVTELIERLRACGTTAAAFCFDEDALLVLSAADALEAQAREIADCNRLRDDERLTWDAQHKRQASMNAHLAELVTDAQEELRKCQQDAIALQDKLTEAVALLREAAGNVRCPYCDANTFMATADRIEAFLDKVKP